VGGNKVTIERYQAKAAKLGIDRVVSFIGPRPVDSLAELLQAATVLVSPRVKGNNTPMKVYSYLHSGTALLATALPTHLQVLDETIAALAPAEPSAFGEALLNLLNDRDLRARLGESARRVAKELYTVEAFEQQLAVLYSGISAAITPDTRPRAEAVENL
jgi:glycosyltransferase involved in cell wall biosynthesis